MTQTSTITYTPLPTATFTFTPTPPSFDFTFGSSGNGNSQFAPADGCYDVAVDNVGNIYVTDYDNGRVEKFNSSGTYLSQWAIGGLAWGIAVDQVTNNVYVCNYSTQMIDEFTSAGTIITSWGGAGTGNSQFNGVTGVGVDASENVYTVDNINNRVQKFTSSGTYITQWGGTGSGSGKFSAPWSLCIDSSYNVYVADDFNHLIQKFTSSGVYLNEWASYLATPFDVGITPSGILYVDDRWNNQIIELNASTMTYVTQWGTAGSGNGQFSKPMGICTDSSGALFVADSSNHRVEKFGP